MPVNWPAHAKDFLSDHLSKKVMPISVDFEEWCVTPCQVHSMSGALDLVRGQALINIEKQPALLVHLVGVGKPDGQVADKRPQQRVARAVRSRSPRIEAISPNSSPAFSVASTSPSRETIYTEPEQIR